MSAREAILQEALLLSASDRALLVDALEESLEHGEFTTPEIAAAWSDEIDKRLAAFRRGDTQAVSVEDAMDRIRRSLDQRRAEQATP